MTIYDELVARGLIAQVTDENEIKSETELFSGHGHLTSVQCILASHDYLIRQCPFRAFPLSICIHNEILLSHKKGIK